MQSMVSYVVTLVVFGAIDAIWLSTMGPAFYRPVLGDILVQDLRVVPALLFYLVFPVGIVVFAVDPAIKAGSLTTAASNGLLFGAIAYATYDLTNYATLRNWTFQITALDIVYGAVAAGAAAVAAVAAIRHLPGWLGGMLP